MKLMPIVAGFILALAHPAAADEVVSTETLACATASQPTAQRALKLRGAPSQACKVEPAQFSSRSSEPARNFSPAPSCAAATPMPRLAAVME
jgi:hypothetical protein